MTRVELASVALLVVAFIGTAALLFVAPAWPVPAIMAVVFGTSLALLGLRRPVGYSVGQLGLFLAFLIGIANSIGDWEVPEYVEPVLSPYLQVAIVCLLFLGCAMMIRRAQAKLQQRSLGMSLT
jgi:hypothetical protein